MNTTSKESSLEAENARLRARVRELESKGSEKPGEGPGKSSHWSRLEAAEDRVRDIPEHAYDTVNRLARGITSAQTEYVQGSLDSVNALLDEVFSRTRKGGKSSAASGEADSSPLDAPRELATDVASGIVECLHRALETPLRAVDRFFDAYYEEGEAGRRRSGDPHPPRHASPRRAGASSGEAAST